MVTAYSQDLYSQFAESNRRLFSLWSQRVPDADHALQVGKNTAQQFNIVDHRGGFYATSILGGATGMSADLLIIDDQSRTQKKPDHLRLKTRFGMNGY